MNQEAANNIREASREYMEANPESEYGYRAYLPDGNGIEQRYAFIGTLLLRRTNLQCCPCRDCGEDQEQGAAIRNTSYRKHGFGCLDRARKLILRYAELGTR